MNPIFILIIILIGSVSAAGIGFYAYTIYNENQQPEQPPIVNNTKPPIVNNTPPIPPKPQPEERTLIFVGDPSGSAGDQVFNRIKTEPFDLVVVLGDLWYGNWDKFQATYGSLGNKVACVLGNHEYDSSEIEKLSLTYCGDNWILKTKNNGVLLVSVNANEGLTPQLTSAKAILSNATYMKDIHTVILNTHQPCANTKNSHHGVESAVKQFCDAFSAAVPSGIDQYFISGHEHLYMEGQSGNKKYFIVGTGGRSHYECGDLPDPIFTKCDDAHYGYLKLKIEPDGDITHAFIDYNGVIVK